MALPAFSDLQLSLAGASLLAVAGVWGYNAWQAYLQRKLAQRAFSGEHAADALMRGAGKTTLADADTDASAGADTDTDATPQRIEPRFDAVDEFASGATTADSQPQAEQSSEPPADLADEYIDCIARFEAAEPVAAPLLWAAQRQLLGLLEGRLCWSGWDEDHGQWRKLHVHDASSYRRLYAALQIADRHGPISNADIARFFDAARQLAVNCRAEIDLPAAADILAHAQALDEFCAGVDWRIGVNVVNRADQPFGAARLIDLATETSLWLKDDGLFHAEDATGLTVFTLGDLGGQPLAADGMSALTLHGVTLSIDVPRVADGAQAFDRLLAVARRLMETFDGLLVDDQRRPLSDEMLAAIRAKIVEFQQKMAEHHIPAGGRRALRLYS